MEWEIVKMLLAQKWEGPEVSAGQVKAIMARFFAVMGSMPETDAVFIFLKTIREQGKIHEADCSNPH